MDAACAASRREISVTHSCNCDGDADASITHWPVRPTVQAQPRLMDQRRGLEGSLQAARALPCAGELAQFRIDLLSSAPAASGSPRPTASRSNGISPQEIPGTGPLGEANLTATAWKRRGLLFLLVREEDAFTAVAVVEQMVLVAVPGSTRSAFSGKGGICSSALLKSAVASSVFPARKGMMARGRGGPGLAQRGGLWIPVAGIRRFVGALEGFFRSLVVPFECISAIPSDC